MHPTYARLQIRKNITSFRVENTQRLRKVMTLKKRELKFVVTYIHMWRTWSLMAKQSHVSSVWISTTVMYTYMYICARFCHRPHHHCFHIYSVGARDECETTYQTTYITLCMYTGRKNIHTYKLLTRFTSQIYPCIITYMYVCTSIQIMYTQKVFIYVPP